MRRKPQISGLCDERGQIVWVTGTQRYYGIATEYSLQRVVQLTLVTQSIYIAGRTGSNSTAFILKNLIPSLNQIL